MAAEDFIVVTRWCEPGEGWQKLEAAVTCTYEEAGRHASEAAHAMDAEHGDQHTWTVDLRSVTHPEYGSYYQLFHGRLQ